MYLKLFITFAYIGVFTFGGGYSMLPMFQRELVEKKRWLTEGEMTDLFSISQCLPGIIAANTAIFVGHKHKGTLGGIAAALGVAMPSVVVIMVIAAFLSDLTHIPAVQNAFVGLRVCVSVLIINAVFRLRKHSLIDLSSILVFLVVFALSIFTSLHVAILVAAAGLFGIATASIRKKMPPDDTPPQDDKVDDGGGK
jgi:chromate transporter